MDIIISIAAFIFVMVFGFVMYTLGQINAGEWYSKRY